MRFPPNQFQQKAHQDALKRTVAYFKTKRYHITQKQVEKVLDTVHAYIVHLCHHMRYWGADKPSVVKVHIGYFRVSFTKLFVEMHKIGEFTDEEFKVITKELYKKEFNIYYKLLKQRKQWLLQNHPKKNKRN